MNAYATHLPVLKKVFGYKKYSDVAEYGMGLYSTLFFIENCERIQSLEMQSAEWYNKIISEFGNKKNWIHAYSPSPDSRLRKKLDLVFVDGHGDSRPECVNAAIELNIEVIIAHDTEEKGYGWERIKLTDAYSSIEIKDNESGVQTTVYSTDHKLIKYLGND